MAPGAVPVIHYSDDDEEGIEQLTKKSPIDILEDADEYDEYEAIARLHKASGNSNVFENMFAHNQGGYPKDNDYSDDGSRNSATNIDSTSNIENEFNILRYLEDKNEMADDAADHESGFKDGDLNVEKKLDPLFKQEVPLTNLYFDQETSDSHAQSKPTTADQSIPYFPSDMGIRLSSRTELDQRCKADSY